MDLLLNSAFSHKFSTEYTLGLVKICQHAVLPNIQPICTFVVIAVGIAGLVVFVRRSERDMFCEGLCLSGLVFFLAGWHVHEKAVLMVAVPML